MLHVIGAYKGTSFIVVPFKNPLNMLFDCFGVRFVPSFSEKKAQLSKGQEIRENSTNMDITWLFLAKPLDQHPGDPKLTMTLQFPQTTFSRFEAPE